MGMDGEALAVISSIFIGTTITIALLWWRNAIIPFLKVSKLRIINHRLKNLQRLINEEEALKENIKVYRGEIKICPYCNHRMMNEIPCVYCKGLGEIDES